jgi:phage baseplate assembly protein W
MKGMSRITGKYLNDLDHLKQSIVDILSTPIGSRVMCRDYGSRLFDLVDKPINKELFPQIYAAIADALQKRDFLEKNCLCFQLLAAILF